METIAQAKEWVQRNAERGCNCPVCGRTVKVYKRRLYAGMASVLAKMYVKYGVDRPFHINDVMEDGYDTEEIAYPKLRYWGLIEPCLSRGEWRVTNEAAAFLKGTLHVPSQVHLLNGKVVGFSEAAVDVHDVMKRRFDLAEVLAA